MGYMLLMTDNRNYQVSPPSEIRQDLWACRGTKAEQGYRGAAPISFIRFFLTLLKKRIDVHLLEIKQPNFKCCSPWLSFIVAVKAIEPFEIVAHLHLVLTEGLPTTGTITCILFLIVL